MAWWAWAVLSAVAATTILAKVGVADHREAALGVEGDAPVLLVLRGVAGDADLVRVPVDALVLKSAASHRRGNRARAALRRSERAGRQVAD